jgi:hypothetical protein
MSKKFSVSDLHRLSPAVDPASSLSVAEAGYPAQVTCNETIIETGVFTDATKK